MSSFENENSKNLSQNILNISRNQKLNLSQTGQFNTFKFKHFNNFFNNLFHEKLKSEIINYLSEKNNKSTSIFKNEFLNETLSEKTLSDFKERRKEFKIGKKNAIANTKLNNIDSYFSHNTNKSTKYKSLDKIYLSKFNQSKFNNKSSSINYSKYLSKGQSTIPNISNRTNNSNNKVKLKLEISSLSNNFNNTKKNKFTNTSETFYNKKKQMNKDQQLPKDAANCLLLFLKQNKKFLQKTTKYNYLYKKYKNIIDNIIENIPDEENNFRKNNYETMLGYYKRVPMEGNNLLNSASLIDKDYNSKSEKERFLYILSELTKLKGYTDKNNIDKKYYIKDFLNKFYIIYNDEQYLIFEKFLEDFDINNCQYFLKPGLRIKDMILKIFEEENKLEQENNEKIKTMPAINLKSNLLNNNDNNKNKGIESYLDHKTKDNNNNNNNLSHKNSHQKILNLSDTNSNLKEMERQKLADKPNKIYAQNYKLIVKDMSKEIEKVENEIITEKQYKNLQHILISKKNKPNLKNIDNDLFITSNAFLKSHTNKKNMNYLSPNVNDKRQRYDKMNTEGILEKLNVQNNFEKVELKDIKRKLKLTEYIIYNKAKNKLKIKELGKGELYEYSKKEEKNGK